MCVELPKRTVIKSHSKKEQIGFSVLAWLGVVLVQYPRVFVEFIKLWIQVLTSVILFFDKCPLAVAYTSH